MAAASVVASEGVEPILTVLTRDRNRIALVSDFLGAQTLGIRNLLCTAGTHQTLGRARAAKNVFDIDSTQLLQALSRLSADGSVVGETRINAPDSRTQIWVVPTNEELIVARQAKGLLESVD